MKAIIAFYEKDKNHNVLCKNFLSHEIKKGR